MNPVQTALSCLLLAVSAAAQRTVVVDAANGPGTNHTTLAAAFANLQNHDLIVLRAGTYTGANLVTAYDFELLGEGSPRVVPAPSTGATVDIALFGSQYQRIAIRGVRFESQNTGQWALSVRTGYNFWPAPSVHLEDVEAHSASPLMDRVGLLAQSVGLTAQRCDLNTSQVIDCAATFVECALWGFDQNYYNFSSQRAQTALDVLRSEVWIVDSTLRAGSSHGVYGEPAACVGFSDNSYTTGSHVYVSGNCTLTADPAPNVSWPVPSVFHNYQWYFPSTPLVEQEAGVVLVPSPGGPVFSTNVASATRTIPSLRASTAPLGGTWTATVHGANGDFAALLVGFASRGHRLLGRTLFVDETLAVTAGFAVLPVGQSAAFPIAVPNSVGLRGLVFEASAALLSPAGAIDATNPAASVVF